MGLNSLPGPITVVGKRVYLSKEVRDVDSNAFITVKEHIDWGTGRADGFYMEGSPFQVAGDRDDFDQGNGVHVQWTEELWPNPEPLFGSTVTPWQNDDGNPVGVHFKQPGI